MQATFYFRNFLPYNSFARRDWTSMFLQENKLQSNARSNSWEHAWDRLVSYLLQAWILEKGCL